LIGKKLIKNNIMDKLEKRYQELVYSKSDINEHLPTLKRYAEDCDSVCEMGVRWVVSTFAFLAGKPTKLTSIDIQSPSEWAGAENSLELAKQIAIKNNIEFKFILSDSLKIEIDEVDMLFIDTWHAYKQLKAELNLHHSKVKKYIALHDTSNFETHDEASYEMWGDDWKGSGEGIWLAITEFLHENKNWTIKERFTNNNGLTILERND
tara:strand:+ start:2928 stop:3551 length:624 start_codon:yes stop_codon:yes gene_type:complete